MGIPAGRIMLLPKGTYDASITYDILDIVTHKGSIWICKRPGTIGIEPTEANTDSWMLALTGAVSDAGYLGGESAAEWQQKIDTVSEATSVNTEGIVANTDDILANGAAITALETALGETDSKVSNLETEMGTTNVNVAANASNISNIISGTQTVGNAEKVNDLSPSEVGESGARNLIPYPYYEATKTVNGITFTDNGDGTITINGTATEQATLNIRTRITVQDTKNPLILSKGKYILSGRNIDKDSTGVYLQIGGNTADGSWFKIADVYKSEGVAFELTEETQAGITVAVVSGATLENYVISPMLEVGLVAHDYVPYHFGGAVHALDAEKVNGVTLYKSFTEIDSTFSQTTPILDLVKAMAEDSKLAVLVWQGTADIYPSIEGVLQDGVLEITKTKTYTSVQFSGLQGEFWVGGCYPNGDAWSGWKNSADGGNADTVDGYHASDFLASTGGTIDSTVFGMLVLKRDGEKTAAIRFDNGNGTLGFIGMHGSPNGGLRRTTADGTTTYTILDESNVGSYALPITGGTLSGYLRMNNTNDYYAVEKTRNISEVAHKLTLGVSSTGATTLEHYAANVLDARLELAAVNSVATIKLEDRPNSVTYTVLHTGNSKPLAIQSSAPSDTSALWVW